MNVPLIWASDVENESAACGNEVKEYRGKVFIVGDLGSGKTSLIQSLLGERSKIIDQPTEGVLIDTWVPFENRQNGNLISSKLNDLEKRLVVDVWDLGGRQICQAAHLTYLTRGALFIVVFNIIDQTSCDSVAHSVNLIQAKCPGSCILLVSTQIDKMTSGTKIASRKQEVLNSVIGSESRLIDQIQAELYKLKLCNVCDKIQERIDYFETLLRQRPKLPDKIIGVSSQTAKGVEELKVKVSECLLDRKIFPHLNFPTSVELSTLKQKITKLKNLGTVLITWSDLSMYCEEFDNIFHDTAIIKESLSYLEITGCIIHYQGTGDDLDSSIICVNPPALACAICSMLVDDDKKSFRIEAGRFWPKETKCKKPDPSILIRALEEIPLKGYAREILFPLLWQDAKLSETQVKMMLELLHSLELVLPHGAYRQNYEELAMPYFPSLSTEDALYMPLMGLLQAGRPQLNWMPKPLKDDIQISWRFEFCGGIFPAILRQMCARCKRLSKDLSSYQHAWNNGLLVKIAESWVHISFEDIRFDICARVNVEEEGDIYVPVDLCWVLLVLFVRPLLDFLKSYPGLIYKISLSAHGDIFYNNHRREASCFFPIHECFSKSTGGDAYLFTDADGPGELDLRCLMRFTESADQNLTSWLNDIAKQQARLIPQPPTLPRTQNTNSQPRPKNVKKKGLPIKWNLNNNKEQAEIIPTKQNLPKINIEQSDELDQSKRATATNEDGRKTLTVVDDREERAGDKMSSPMECEQTAATNETAMTARSKYMSEEDEIKAATSVAATFVAAILAKAVAEYIESAYEDNHQMSHKISQVQVTAAKIAAEAATATQMGNIDGAAKAVLHAAQGVQDAIDRDEKKHNEQSFNRSKTCVLL